MSSSSSVSSKTSHLKLCSALGCDSDILSELSFLILFSKTQNQKLMAAALAPYPKPNSGAGFSTRSSELLPFLRTRTNSASSVALQVPSKKLPLVTASATHNALPLSHTPAAVSTASKVKRHTISLFVGDKSGIINKIAGVFARRGYNIESLAVGLNEDKALFTVVVSGTERVLRQLHIHDLERAVPNGSVVPKNNGSLNGNTSTSSGGDVYPVEPYDDYPTKILDAHWGVLYDEDSSGFRSHTLTMLVNNTPGVLNIVTGELYLEESLAVGPAEMEGLSRITTVVPGTDESIGQLVQDITNFPFAERELMLIKIAVSTSARRDVLDIAKIFRARAVDVSDHTITLELTGDLNKIIALQRLLETYGICELARTGRVALVRESGVDSTSLRGYPLPIDTV
ncbi:hypothetical protein Pint_11661 [Pistacia integerrima]|uniref:Uncharacterized protein n=1 Tax=Pistacia integerrima TaxID=434235 RepID=A0ACC0XL34_9ROSI|nr:hypothetical protein Pint_11661 [Pistacia integerrima]